MLTLALRGRGKQCLASTFDMDIDLILLSSLVLASQALLGTETNMSDWTSDYVTFTHLLVRKE